MEACSNSPPVALKHTRQQLSEDPGSTGKAERHFCTVAVNHTASASQLSEKNTLRLLGQGEHMAEIKQTEEAEF